MRAWAISAAAASLQQLAPAEQLIALDGDEVHDAVGEPGFECRKEAGPWRSLEQGQVAAFTRDRIEGPVQALQMFLAGRDDRRCHQAFRGTGSLTTVTAVP